MDIVNDDDSSGSEIVDWVLLDDTVDESEKNFQPEDEEKKVTSILENQTAPVVKKDDKMENHLDESAPTSAIYLGVVDDFEEIEEVDEKTEDSFSILSFCEDLLEDIDLVSKIRCYTHKRNAKVNKFLDALVMLALAMATGLGIGNFIGKSNTCSTQYQSILPVQPHKVQTALQIYTLNNSPAAMMLHSVAKDKLYYVLNSEHGVKQITDPSHKIDYNWNWVHFKFNLSFESKKQCKENRKGASEIPDEQPMLVEPETNNETKSIQTSQITSISYYPNAYHESKKENETVLPSPTFKANKQNPKQVESVERHIKRSKKILYQGMPDISYNLLDSLKSNIKSIVEQTQDLILSSFPGSTNPTLHEIRLKMVQHMFKMYLSSVENKINELHHFTISSGFKHVKRTSTFKKKIHIITKSVDILLNSVFNEKVSQKEGGHPNKLRDIYDRGLTVIENFEKKWLKHTEEKSMEHTVQDCKPENVRKREEYQKKGRKSNVQMRKPENVGKKIKKGFVYTIF